MRLLKSTRHNRHVDYFYPDQIISVWELPLGVTFRRIRDYLYDDAEYTDIHRIEYRIEFRTLGSRTFFSHFRDHPLNPHW